MGEPVLVNWEKIAWNSRRAMLEGRNFEGFIAKLNIHPGRKLCVFRSRLIYGSGIWQIYKIKNRFKRYREAPNQTLYKNKGGYIYLIKIWDKRILHVGLCCVYDECEELVKSTLRSGLASQRYIQFWKIILVQNWQINNKYDIILWAYLQIFENEGSIPYCGQFKKWWVELGKTLSCQLGYVVDDKYYNGRQRVDLYSKGSHFSSDIADAYIPTSRFALEIDLTRIKPTGIVFLWIVIFASYTVLLLVET